MFDGARWWARREVKADKLPPPDFVALEHDDETGKTVGWEPVEASSFARWHGEAAGIDGWEWTPGTYELAGPKVNGNPESLGKHMLIKHEQAEELDAAPRTFAELAAWLHAHDYEGIVWHREDGKMAKIKKRDFPKPP